MAEHSLASRIMAVAHQRLSRPLQRVNPLAVQLGVAVGGAAFAGIIGWYGLSSVGSSGSAARGALESALAASNLERVVAEFSQLQFDPISAGATTAGTAAPPVNVSPATAIRAKELIDEAVAYAADLHQANGTLQTLELLGAAGDTADFFSRYLASGSQSDYDELVARLDGLRAHAGQLRPDFVASSATESDRVTSTVNLARTAIVSVAVLIAILTAATTGLIGRRLRGSLRLARDEAQRLILVTEGKDRRNAQFQALYQVVTEVTENLSLRYVVETAVTQAQPLIRAEEVRLRLLRDDLLVVVGATATDEARPEVAEMPLGTGAVGRAARRGRSLRTGDIASLAFPVPEAPAGTHSGLVVPLIVGARVVGTIECWSAQPDAFDVDDERVLELMASQVATAVSAADTNEASERDAHHDPLTGLPNRRQFARDVRERFAPELRAGEQYAFAMIDIDHFKRFNDDYGHRVGDITLQRVAEVMRSAIREGDAIYRYGGEEFTIVVPFAEREEVESLLDRVRLAVSRTSLTGENLQPLVPVTVSIGVAFGPALGTDPDALTVLADRALYHSKATGRNRITVYGAALEDALMGAEPLVLAPGAARGGGLPAPSSQSA